jgi:hypothetical protein
MDADGHRSPVPSAFSPELVELIGGGPGELRPGRRSVSVQSIV